VGEADVLARLAENLFWAGRYVERAEDTARMVDVTYHTLLESPMVDVGRSWEQLLDVLHLATAYREAGVAGDGSETTDVAMDPQAVVAFLALALDNPGSIATSVVRARENIRSVREHVSSELWEAVNGLHLTLQRPGLEQDVGEQPSELLRHVRDAGMAIYGIASETMPRDDGWRFLALGRMLERAEMTCRLIDVRYGQLAALDGTSRRLHPVGSSWVAGPTTDPARTERTDFHHWIGVLKSASALEAYRRRYWGSTDPADVVEFLLLTDDLPRSVLFCLTSAMRQLEALTDGRGSRAVRLTGRAASSLRYRDVSELFAEDLHAFLEDVQLRIQEIAEAVADEFFRHHPDGAMHSVAGS
jgi:uncharacterized alpha-E superfamily protein